MSAGALPFDKAVDRPEQIDNILNGLDRYNPETTAVFENYVKEQCDNRTYDAYANLALLKLYQFNPHLNREETITNILVKSLTVFPAADFSLGVHLLPSHILHPASAASAMPAAGDAPLSEAVQKLSTLNTLLCSAEYTAFWRTLDSDDLYADLVADVVGFEDLMRLRIAVTVGQSCREVDRRTMEEWLRLKGEKFETFLREICGWGLDSSGRGNKAGEGQVVVIPVNKENEAKGTVLRENVSFDQFARVVKRAYEQPA